MRTGRMPERWVSGHCVEDGHYSGRVEHIQACVAANCYPHQPPAYSFHDLPTKQQEIDYLPRHILDLTWTCRTPRIEGERAHEGGCCKTCEMLSGFGITGRSRSLPER